MTTPFQTKKMTKQFFQLIDSNYFEQSENNSTIRMKSDLINSENIDLFNHLFKQLFNDCEIVSCTEIHFNPIELGDIKEYKMTVKNLPFKRFEIFLLIATSFYL